MNVEAEPTVAVSGALGIENVPRRVRNLSSFEHPNYIDCFAMDTPYASGCAPEVWARAMLEESSLSRDARVLWTLMGLRLGPPASLDHVQGWRIERQGDDWMRLQTSSWYLSAGVLFLVEPDRLLASLSLRYDAPVARLIWAVVSNRHQKAVPVMMRQADRLLLR